MINSNFSLFVSLCECLRSVNLQRPSLVSVPRLLERIHFGSSPLFTQNQNADRALFGGYDCPLLSVGRQPWAPRGPGSGPAYRTSRPSTFSGLRALPTNLAELLELSAIQNMEAASRFERAQSAAWSNLARGGGSLQIIKGELVKLNRDRLH